MLVEVSAESVYTSPGGVRYVTSEVVHRGWQVSHRDSHDFLLAHSQGGTRRTGRPLPELYPDKPLRTWLGLRLLL